MSMVASTQVQSPEILRKQLKHLVIFDSVAEFVAAKIPQKTGRVQVTGYYGGWSDTVEGPRGGFTAHRTGYTADSPSVGNPAAPSTIGTGKQAGLYWTADGAEWQMSLADVNVWTFGYTGSGGVADANALIGAINFSRRAGHFSQKKFDLLVSGVAPLAQMGRFWGAVESGEEDIYLLVIGDSTGNSKFEWVWQLALLWAEDNPTHSVRYRLYEDGSGWMSEEAVSSGSGPRSIYIDNVSIPGAIERDVQGAKRASIYDSGRVYDLVIFNHGHNEGTSVPYRTILAGFTEAIFDARHCNPNASIIATVQNPRLDFPDHSARVSNAWRTMSAVHGIGLIDVYGVIQSLGVPTGLYTDGTHPNELGMQLWTLVAYTALNRPSGNIDAPLRGYSYPAAANYIKNAAFFQWFNGSPREWESNGVTVAPEPSLVETGPVSLRITATDNGGLAWVDLSKAIRLLRGQWLTFIARVWAGSDSTANSGRIQIRYDSTSVSSRGQRAGKGGWTWVAVHALIPTDASSLTVRVLAGDSGESVVIDRVWAGVGLAPSDIELNSQPPVALSSYYSPGNVGMPAGRDGILTVDGSSISVTGNIEFSARAYVNLFWLEPGATYRVTWERGNASTGDVFARKGLNGGGAVIGEVELEDASGSLEFMATEEQCSILFEADGVMPLSVTNVEIVRA